ncbi:hypothetical protein GGS20DRAFT_586728 [Poronia punctata]|nr:hypothetical protein GGS20DRAFT_586728 [Poronia punctata]
MVTRPTGKLVVIQRFGSQMAWEETTAYRTGIQAFRSKACHPVTLTLTLTQLQLLNPENPVWTGDQVACPWARLRSGSLIVKLGKAMTQWIEGISQSNFHKAMCAPEVQWFVDKVSVVHLARPEENANRKELSVIR